MKTVLIIGAARSGTKMLGNIFSMNKDVKYFGEVNNIWRSTNAKSPHDAISLDSAPVDLIRNRFKYEEGNGSILVEKTAANCLRMPLVMEVFPNAKIIHIVRDGRDVALSASEKWKGNQSSFEKNVVGNGKSGKLTVSRIIKKMRGMSLNEIVHKLPKGAGVISSFLGWKKESYWGPMVPGIKEFRQSYSLLETCAYQWRISEESVLNYFEANKQLNRLDVKYEELCENPDRELKRIFEYCGIEKPSNYKEMVSLIKKGNGSKWKEKMSDDELEKVENLIGFLLKHYNYM